MSRLWAYLSGSLQSIALAAAAVLQLVLLSATTVLPLAKGVFEMRGDSARERSIRLTFGDSFAGYIEFLNQLIPQDALVVLPPAEHNSDFGHVGLMQYMLFPRRLTNCPTIAQWDTCKANYLGPTTYLISVDGFPPPGVPIEAKEYITFDARRGVFVPVGFVP